MTIRNAKYNSFGTIDCEVEHQKYGWIPFTASPHDSEEYGRNLFTSLANTAAVYVTPAREIGAEKATKLKTIEQMRLTKCKAGVSFGGKTIPTDKDALLLLQAAQMFIGKNPTATFKKAGLGEFNAAAIEGIITAVGNMQRPIFAHEAALYDAITAATTLNELDAIDIEAGW